MPLRGGVGRAEFVRLAAVRRHYRSAVPRLPLVLARDRAGRAVGDCSTSSRPTARKIPNGPGAIVSPADGTIVDITPLANYDFIGEPAVRIGIFLSIFNVHINRAPLAGRVVDMHYKPGEFLNAMKPESAIRNEFMWIGLETTEKGPRGTASPSAVPAACPRIVCRCNRVRRYRRARSLV